MVARRAVSNVMRVISLVRSRRSRSALSLDQPKLEVLNPQQHLRVEMDELFTARTKPYDIEDLFNRRLIIVAGLITVIYGLTVGFVVGSILDFAPYIDPETKAFTLGLLFPVGDAVDIVGGLLRALGAIIGDDAVGLAVAWPVYVVTSAAVAFSQSFVVVFLIVLTVRSLRWRRQRDGRRKSGDTG
jgi:hypothetical protein